VSKNPHSISLCFAHITVSPGSPEQPRCPLTVPAAVDARATSLTPSLARVLPSYA
jgi:hypothetical protein